MVDTLVSAKDEQQPMELSLRVETLKKVLTLSLAEAKDAKIKLLDFTNLTGDEKHWQEEAIVSLASSTQYFEEVQNSIIDAEKPLTLDEVKTIAKELKEWRDAYYVPTLTMVRDYLLIDQQEKTIETASKRAERINVDIMKLEKAKIKNISKARAMLVNANTLISNSEKSIASARALFVNTFISPATTTATSSQEKASSTETLIKSTELATSSTKSADASSTEAVSTSTSTSTEKAAVVLPTSIRDYVKDSLMKVRESYVVFIEMSNFVRELLK
jgi:hypothetical protein